MIPRLDHPTKDATFELEAGANGAGGLGGVEGDGERHGGDVVGGL